MPAKPKVVVIGGGFGGLETTFNLRHKLGDKVDLTLVSERDLFLIQVPRRPQDRVAAGKTLNKWLPRSRSLVITDPPSLHGESLASLIASFSSLTRKTSATGATIGSEVQGQLLG